VDKQTKSDSVGNDGCARFLGLGVRRTKVFCPHAGRITEIRDTAKKKLFERGPAKNRIHGTGALVLRRREEKKKKKRKKRKAFADVRPREPR